MNNYENELIDELEIASELFNIDSKAIQEFRRESRQKKTDKNRKLNKKIKNVKIDEEKE